MRISRRSLSSVKEFQRQVSGKSELDFIIAAEIVDDAFSYWIRKLSNLSHVKTILEIGSSSGAGSTKAFVQSISQRPDSNDVSFYCLELSNVRFAALQQSLSAHPFAKPLNLSSVSTQRFPSEDEVRNFYTSRDTKLNSWPLGTILTWRQQDIDYILQSGRDVDGVLAVKSSHDIENFDMCLIDGSQFTGSAELADLIGSGYILLDDTETFKCRNAFETLDKHPDYELLVHDPYYRNGFAVFKHEAFGAE